MVYIKILNSDGTAVAVEAIESPVYVFCQPSNGAVLRCIEVKAQGILDATGAKIYQLMGKEQLEQAAATAVIITRAEYEELLATLGSSDPEDADPVIPDGTEGTSVMTRLELTEKVNELDEALALILSGVTE